MRRCVAPRRAVLSCVCWWVWDSNARSSVKSRSSIAWIPFLLCVVHCFIIQSKAMRRRNGNSRQPCLTLVLTENEYAVHLPCERDLLVVRRSNLTN